MFDIPLRFREIPKEKVWGSDRLRTLAGKPFEAGRPIGESWEISDHAGDVSIVAEGPLEGRRLDDLLKDHGDAIMGEALVPRHGAAFPLLLKLLDTSSGLSVQVHPTDAQAAEMGIDDLGKTEAWHVLHAEPGAVMFHGLWDWVTREEFQRMVDADTVERAVRCFPVRPGDTLFCPAGTVHAIGAGVTLFEIQQSSDTTFRVFDWHRPQDPANPRPLHLEESMRVINFDRQPPQRQEPETLAASPFQRERLVACEKFEVQRWTLDTDQQIEAEPHRFEILCIVSGSGTISAGGETLSLKPGDSILLPAAVAQWGLSTPGALSLLRVTVPDTP